MRRYTEQEKQQLLQSWKSSGQSANSFAKDKPFSASSLKYWEGNTLNTTQSSFIHVIPNTTVGSPYARITYPSGIVIDFFTSVNLTEVKELIQ